MREVAVAVV
jgi:hypothetical protein